jgi:hypothetical protein
MRIPGLVRGAEQRLEKKKERVGLLLAAKISTRDQQQAELPYHISIGKNPFYYDEFGDRTGQYMKDVWEEANLLLGSLALDRRVSFDPGASEIASVQTFRRGSALVCEYGKKLTMVFAATEVSA